MDERFVRVSAYAGKNCCPLKIRGLDPEKDEQEALEAVMRMMQNSIKATVVAMEVEDGLTRILDMKLELERASGWVSKE